MQKKSILIVDDEEDIRISLHRFLSKKGFEVATAKEGNEALDYFRSNPVPVVISDVRMPGMNGIELMHHLKALDEDVEMIILTGYASLENAVEAMRENGAFEYILKPIEDLNFLVNAINKAWNYSHLKKENKKLIAELEYLATTDALTQTSNRHHFFECVNREVSRSLRSGEPLSIAIFDADFFKLVNDTYGHAMGDIVLKEMAECTKKVLRETDIVGRIGGEEFGIVLIGTGLKEAKAVLERLREHIAQLSFSFKGELFKQTISIGLSEFREGDKAESLMARADKAMYEAKAKGRNKLALD